MRITIDDLLEIIHDADSWQADFNDTPTEQSAAVRTELLQMREEGYDTVELIRSR